MCNKKERKKRTPARTPRTRPQPYPLDNSCSQGLFGSSHTLPLQLNTMFDSAPASSRSTAVEEDEEGKLCEAAAVV